MLIFVVDLILLVANIIAGVVMMMFSLMDIWSYLMTIVPSIVVLIFTIVQNVMNTKREARIKALPGVFTLLNLVHYYVEENIRVRLASQRYCPNSTPFESSDTVAKSVIDKHLVIIKDFAKAFGLNFKNYYSLWLTDRNTIRALAEEEMKKLKLTDSEILLIQSKIEKY